MSNGFISNGPVSGPINSHMYSLHANLNGFGWDINKGMFIPVDEDLNYFRSPFNKAEIKKIPND